MTKTKTKKEPETKHKKVKRTEVKEKVVTKKVKEVVLTFEGKVLNKAEEAYLKEIQLLKERIDKTDDFLAINKASDRCAQIIANLRLVRSL